MGVKFTIYGNQENINGNPIGYHRTTQGSYWNKSSKRYYAWKQHVVAAYVKATGVECGTDKPVAKSKDKIYLHTKIYFANNTRSDPDNVQKGIADALFQDDKYVAGSYDFFMDKENPRVEVELSPSPHSFPQ